jgi:hypothetical protein
MARNFQNRRHLSGSILAGVAIGVVVGMGAGAPARGAAPVPPPKIEEFLKECGALRRGAIAELEHKLRGLRGEKAPSQRLTAQIAKVEGELRALRTSKEPIVPALRFPPSVGAIGRLPRLTCHVERIVSDREMLARCYFSFKVVTVEHFQARGETVVQPVTVLVRGLPTREMQAGADVELLQVFEIVDSVQYKTGKGKPTTVWVLTEFDMRAIAPYLQSAAR